MEKKKVSKVSVQINIAYLLASAASQMLRDAEVRMYMHEGGAIKHEIKQKFTRLQKCIGDVKRLEEQIDEDIFGCFNDGNYADYEYWQEDFNEICRLMLLWADRCDQNPEGKNGIFKALRELPTIGLFAEDDIDRFRLKKLK